MLANKLNEGALRIMKVAPVFMLLFGWWQLSSHTIFHGYSEEHERFSKLVDKLPDHSHETRHIDVSLPFLIFFPLFVWFGQWITIKK